MIWRLPRARARHFQALGAGPPRSPRSVRSPQEPSVRSLVPIPHASGRDLSKAPVIESAIRSRAAMHYPPTQPRMRLMPLALGICNGPETLAGSSRCGEPPGGCARVRGTSNESTGPAAPVPCATPCRQPSSAWAAICGGHGQVPAEPLQNGPKPLPPEHPVPERRVGAEGRDTASSGMPRGGGTLKGRWARH